MSVNGVGSKLKGKGGGGLDIKNLHQQKKSFGYGYV